jgi:hypothetical protein
LNPSFCVVWMLSNCDLVFLSIIKFWCLFHSMSMLRVECTITIGHSGQNYTIIIGQSGQGLSLTNTTKLNMVKLINNLTL